VLTEQNLGALLVRAAFRTKREVEELVVSLRPRAAPAPGIRKLPAPKSANEPAALGFEIGASAEPDRSEPEVEELGDATRAAAPTAAPCPPQAAKIDRRRPTEIEAIAQDLWSLRATVDRRFKDDLETLCRLLAHKVPDGDLTKVLHEAVRCAVERHGKRRGAVPPSRKASRPAPPARKTREPAAEVKRKVWERDGGRCTYVAPDGRRCDCCWQLEFDHIDETKPATADNTRLCCRPHNMARAAPAVRPRAPGAAPTRSRV
jgi:hypothetical protein